MHCNPDDHLNMPGKCVSWENTMLMAHTWENGSCSFHPQLTCSCGKCNDEIKCMGMAYQSKYTLSCPLHSMAYELECEVRASKASSVIHDQLGRGTRTCVKQLSAYCQDFVLTILHCTGLRTWHWPIGDSSAAFLSYRRYMDLTTLHTSIYIQRWDYPF